MAEIDAAARAAAPTSVPAGAAKRDQLGLRAPGAAPDAGADRAGRAQTGSSVQGDVSSGPT